MSKIEFRGIAKRHVQAARALMASGEEREIPYACLELRMAIEALSYDLFQLYTGEHGASAQNAWTPKQVMRELLYLDPDAEKDHDLSITVPAVGDRPEQVIRLGHEHRLRARWADRAHNALGNFLHQPTIKQRTSLDVSDRASRAKSKAEEIAGELDQILASPVSGFRAHRLVRFDCVCGTVVARDVEFLEAGKEVSCPQCGCIYGYTRHDDSSFAFVPRTADWKCSSCSKRNLIPLHELVEGRILRCECGAAFKIERPFALKRDENASP